MLLMLAFFFKNPLSLNNAFFNAGTIARCLVIIADLPDSSELSSRLILDVSSVRSFFIEVVFLRWVGVFEYKNHPKPKKS